MTPIRLLTAAIHADDATSIKSLLAQHPELLNEKSRTFYAASSGYLEALKALLDSGFTIHDRDKLSPGVSLLNSAVMGGALNIVGYLIKKGADARKPGILNGAVATSVEMMQLLIHAGADPYSVSGKPPRDAFRQAQISGTEATRAFLETLRDQRKAESTLVELLQGKLGGKLIKLDRYLLAGAPFWMARCQHGDKISAMSVGLSNTNWQCEFRVVLPGSWPDTNELGADAYWPVDYLLDVLRSLHGQSGLPNWQTVANGEPPTPLAAGSNLVGGVFVSELDNREAPRVMTLMLLTAPELELARRNTEKFAEAMCTAEINPFQATVLLRGSAV